MAVFESTKREYHTAEMCVPAVFRKIQVRAKKKERERQSSGPAVLQNGDDPACYLVGPKGLAKEKTRVVMLNSPYGHIDPK